MRRFNLFFLSCICMLPCTMVAKNQQHTDSVAAKKSSTEVLGVHPYKQTTNLASDIAHWSLSFEAGFNLIDADFKQMGVTILPETRVRPTGGIALEYSFTPTWGIAGVYSYANYGVKQKEMNTVLLEGHMHSLELLLTYDLVDAWFPRRRTDIFSCYLLAGLGMGLYNGNLYLPDAPVAHPRDDGKYDMVGMISVGMAAEFNVSREVALGVKGMYHVYTGDNLDAKIQGTNNDCMEYCNAYLRWKIGGRKKNHVRNYASDAVLLSKLAENQPQQKPLKDTIVVMHKDTLLIQQTGVETTVQQSMVLPEQRYYVYFDHGKAELNERALIAIQQLAAVLQEDTEVCVEVSGYCDKTGTEKYNEALAQKRAERVREELIRVYGITGNRLIAIGKGMITNVGTAYGPNRRVEMRLVSQQECDSLRQCTAMGTYCAENADKEKQAELYVAVVKTQKNRTTLSKLARKYYGNTDCWVYIYEANRDVLKNPDFIPENITLRIPRLTAAQMTSDNEETRTLVKKYSGK